MRSVLHFWRNLFEIRFFVPVLTAGATDENCAGVACIGRRDDVRNEDHHRFASMIEDPARLPSDQHKVNPIS
jgi:hypothetical protein